MLLLVHSGPDPTHFMETLNGSDRLLALFFQPDSAPAPAALELNEDDIFLTGSESPNPNPNPNPNSPSSDRRRISYRNLGILAALPDRNPNRNPNLIPKVSMSSSSSSAMAIPPPAKAEKEKEVVCRSSAPVSIPVVSGRNKGMEVEYDDEMMMMTMLPPHEMVARREGRGRGPSAMTTFSVLEGAGRTLKGRDLRRVRNAVFRRTGFVD